MVAKQRKGLDPVWVEDSIEMAWFGGVVEMFHFDASLLPYVLSGV